MSKSRNEFTLQPLVLNQPLIPGQLNVWHRGDRNRPSIFLRIPQDDLEQVKQTGLNWATLELDPQAIENALTSLRGLGRKHRRVLVGTEKERVEIHVDTTYIRSKEQMTVATIIVNRGTGKECVLRTSLPTAALHAAAQIYKQFAYAMRTMLILRDGLELTTGSDDTLLSDMVDAIDHADKELDKRYHEAARLRASAQEQQEHREAGQQKRDDARTPQPTEAPTAVTTATTEVAPPATTVTAPPQAKAKATVPAPTATTKAKAAKTFGQRVNGGTPKVPGTIAAQLAAKGLVVPNTPAPQPVEPPTAPPAAPAATETELPPEPAIVETTTPTADLSVATEA